MNFKDYFLKLYLAVGSCPSVDSYPPESKESTEGQGKQPINSSELSFYVYGNTPQHPEASIVNNIIGFTNRYMEYKTCVNKVHGSFISGGNLSAWASPRNNPLFVSEGYSSVFITKTSLKVDPRILNPIMAVSFVGLMNTH